MGLLTKVIDAFPAAYVVTLGLGAARWAWHGVPALEYTTT